MSTQSENSLKMAALRAAQAKYKPEPVEALVIKLRRVMENNGTYQESMDFAIYTAAAAYHSFLKAQADVARLKKTWYETKTREGNVKYEAHPAVKTMKDCHAMLIDSLKTLGLTMDMLTAAPYDPLAELQNRYGEE